MYSIHQLSIVDGLEMVWLVFAWVGLWFGTCYGQPTGDYTLSVVNGPNSTLAVLKPSLPDNDDVTVIFNKQSLLSECQHCNISVHSNGTLANALVPLNGGVLYLRYAYQPGKGTLMYSDHHIIPIGIDRGCSPISVTFIKQFVAIILCRNLTSLAPFVDYVMVHLNPTNASLSFITLLGTWEVVNAGLLSEPLYLHNQANCPMIAAFISSNIFMIDGAEAVAYLSSPSLNELSHLTVLPHDTDSFCPRIIRLEYPGSNRALIRCSNTTVVQFSLCNLNSAIVYRWAEGGVPYPCSNWDTIITHLPNNSLILNKAHLSSIVANSWYPVEDAICINGDNPVFLSVLTNGTVVALVINKKRIFELTRLLNASQYKGRFFSASADPSIIKLNDGQIFRVINDTGFTTIVNLLATTGGLSTTFTAIHHRYIPYSLTLDNTSQLTAFPPQPTAGLPPANYDTVVSPLPTQPNLDIITNQSIMYSDKAKASSQKILVPTITVFIVILVTGICVAMIVVVWKVLKRKSRNFSCCRNSSCSRVMEGTEAPMKETEAPMKETEAPMKETEVPMKPQQATDNYNSTAFCAGQSALPAQMFSSNDVVEQFNERTSSEDNRNDLLDKAATLVQRSN